MFNRISCSQQQASNNINNAKDKLLKKTNSSLNTEKVPNGKPMMSTCSFYKLGWLLLNKDRIRIC